MSDLNKDIPENPYEIDCSSEAAIGSYVKLPKLRLCYLGKPAINFYERTLHKHSACGYDHLANVVFGYILLATFSKTKVLIPTFEFIRYVQQIQ